MGLNNGVFTQNDVTIEWRGDKYSFFKGYPPDVLSFRFLTTAHEVMGNLIFETSLMAQVLAIPDVENLYHRLGHRPTVASQTPPLA